MKKRFHSATDEEILEGRVTDVYFFRALETLKKHKINKKVVMEIHTKSLPANYRWGVLCGLEENLRLLEGKKVDVYGFEEGSIFYPEEPVITLEGYYDDFGLFETSILGFLCQASGIATRAARLRIISEGKKLLSFGARRIHPAIAPMVERACYIGGCDGVAAVKSAELIGIKPAGTVPHSLILLFGDTLAGFKAFSESIGENIPKIALVDTFSDEKTEALRIAEAMGDKLAGIRLDTPSSRRGNIKKIVEEIRWELNLRGFSGVQIIVSGGLSEESIKELADVVDAFGVGTYLSNSPVIDFSMDIVEIEGRPIAKKGKKSGKKTVLRCKKCLEGKVIPYSERAQLKCACGGEMERVQKKLIENGKIVANILKPDKIREKVLRQLKYLKDKL